MIEAIKSAPDIKVTRKKVLDYIPVTIEKETTEATARRFNALAQETNATSNFVIPKFKKFESIDDDEENYDFYQYNKKFVKNKKNDLEVKWEGKREDMDKDSYKATTTSYPPTTISFFNEAQEDEKNSVFLEKIDMKKRDNDKRYETFIDDTDENDEAILITTKSPQTLAAYVTTQHNKPDSTTTFVKLSDGHSFLDVSTNKINRLKLDWIEESYNQEDERKETPRLIETTTQKLAPTHTILVVVTRTAVKKERKLNKYDDPVSSMSREITDVDLKRSRSLKSKYDNNEANLLNSLDYATENTEMAADSTEERTKLEQFPMDFV